MSRETFVLLSFIVGAVLFGIGVFMLSVAFGLIMCGGLTLGICLRSVSAGGGE